MDSLLASHIEHLRKRIDKMNNTYHDSWPRWTYADYRAVGSVLRALEDAQAHPEDGDVCHCEKCWLERHAQREASKSDK